MDTKVKVLIVEDEALIAFTMKEMISDFGFEQITIKNTYEDAVTFMDEEEFDIAVLDINLKDGDEGIELAKKCMLADKKFFYVTSYTDKRTLDLALETFPGAYVVKPVVQTNLYSAISLTLNNFAKPKPYKFIKFRDGKELIRLNTEEITFLRADGVYVEINTINKKYLIRNSLHTLSEELPKSTFYQTHRSFIVNSTYIKSIGSDYVSVDEQIIPVSRKFKQELKEFYLSN